MRELNPHDREDAEAISSFVSDEDLRALADEAEVMGDEDVTATAERLFKDSLPSAVLSIVKLANNAPSDRVRLDASKYIVERNMGRLQDIHQFLGTNPIDKFLDSILNSEEDASSDSDE